MEEPKRPTLSKTCHPYPWHSYILPKKDPPKKYKSSETPLEFYWHQHFFSEKQQLLLYQERHIKIAIYHIISYSFKFV